MDKKDRTAAIVDGTLNFLVTGSAMTAGLLIPNLMVALEKPLGVFWKQIDKRQREREMRRTITYMKSRKLIRGDYEHGLQITAKGHKRLERNELGKLDIKKPPRWDQMWRLVFFDVPEDQRQGRVALTRKLKELGFYQLQKSAWIHPFPCREIIERICSFYDVDEFVSYVEVAYIDNQAKLKSRFKSVL